MNTKFILYFVIHIYAVTAFGQDRKPYETDIYYKRLEEFKTSPLAEKQIVFLGNSLIQNGEWEKYFPNQTLSNRGIIGNNTEGMLTLLDDILSSQPSKIFFIGGINDISQNKTNEEILNNIETIIHRTKVESPKTKLYIHSLLPINNTFERYKLLKNKEKQIKKLNKSLEKMCKKEHITFINLYPLFSTQQKDILDSNLTNDGLHLTKEGYLIWVEKKLEYIEE